MWKTDNTDIGTNWNIILSQIIKNTSGLMLPANIDLTRNISIILNKAPVCTIIYDKLSLNRPFRNHRALSCINNIHMNRQDRL